MQILLGIEICAGKFHLELFPCLSIIAPQYQFSPRGEPGKLQRWFCPQTNGKFGYLLILLSITKIVDTQIKLPC